MFSKEQQRILGFPMSRIQRGIGALLEDMKRRGVPIPREFQGMVGMPVISESFQDFLQSTSLPLQGGKRKTRKTRKTRKGGSRGSLVLKCLLFVTQYYVFGEVFQLAQAIYAFHKYCTCNESPWRTFHIDKCLYCFGYLVSW